MVTRKGRQSILLMVHLKISNIEMMMKMKNFIPLIFLAFITITVFAQKETDTTVVIIPLKEPDTIITVTVQKQIDTTIMVYVQMETDEPVTAANDVIVKTNGNLFQCRIIEVNDSLAIYTLPTGDTAGQSNTVPRSEIYAIAYGNGIAMVITPELMGQQATISSSEGGCEAWETFKTNLGNGTINVGVGFVDIYTPLKDTKSYEDTKTMPSVFAGYTFKIKGKLKGGIHVGVGGNELTKSGVSEYDQLKVSAEIKESYLCVGLYCRYDILDGIIKPYVKGGVDFMGVFMTTTSEAEALNGSGYSVKTVVQQSGIKPGLILRGGLDFMLGSRFGIYGDVGTGLSLVQFGVLFSIE
jgi:hypothetical protein